MTKLTDKPTPSSSTERTDERIPMRQRLRYRISLAFGLIMIVAFSVSSGALSVRGYLNDIASSSDRLRGIASVLASTVAGDFQLENRNGVMQSLTAIRDLPEIEFVAIEDMKGARFADIGTATFLTTQRNEISSVSSIDLLLSSTIWVKSEIRKGGEQIGWIYLLSDISRIRSAALQGLAINALIALVATITALLAASRAVAKMMRPLSELSGLMRSLSRNAQYSVRADANAQGEIGVLAESFNTMLSRIESRDQQLRDYRFNLEQKVETRTQQLRAAKDEAEAANKAKSDFLATMSHEIRTPMNGMMVMAQLLVKAPLAEQYRRYANVISRSGQGLLTIINDILDISKIEAGKLELEKVDVAPDEIVSGVISLFWERAREKDLELGFHVAADVPQLVQADQTRLTQVVTNLVNNALKFTEQGGVSLRMNAVESKKPGHCRLRVTVMDTGIGIAEEKLKTVFERFTQADQSTTRKFGGTGLGLSISQRLVEAMGGEIGVTSRLRKGSTFWFEVDLPVVKAARHPSPAVLQRRRIAIVTRGAIEGTCLEAAFVEQGFEVNAGPGGLPHSSAVHAVLCDPALINTLPHGYDQVPVVAIAGLGDQSVAALLASGRASDVLNLPFERSELREMAERIRVREFRGPAAIAEVAAVASELPDFSGLRILAVDDNLVNREVLKDALVTFNIDVTLAESGEEALDLVSLNDYDLVFMDCSMPGMDGFEATRHIRDIEAHLGRKPVPVVALTAHVSGEESQKWRQSGMDGYLTKPFTIESIVQMIREQTHHQPGRLPASQPEQVLMEPDRGEVHPDIQAEMQAEMQVEVQELAAAPHEVAAITGTPSIEDLVPFDLRVDEAEAEADEADMPLHEITDHDRMVSGQTAQATDDEDMMSEPPHWQHGEPHRQDVAPEAALVEDDGAATLYETYAGMENAQMATAQGWTDTGEAAPAHDGSRETDMTMMDDSGPAEPEQEGIVRKHWRDAELISAETLNLLETLSANGNSNIAAKIFGMFIQHAEPAIAELRELLTRQSSASAAKPAHALKSMSLSAGAPVVAGILQRIEDYCKAGEPSKAALLLDELELAFAETRKAMQEMMAGGVAPVAASA